MIVEFLLRYFGRPDYAYTEPIEPVGTIEESLGSGQSYRPWHNRQNERLNRKELDLVWIWLALKNYC